MYDRFLEHLYYGNVCPVERRLDKQSKSYRIGLLESAAQNEFRKKLSGDMKKEFDNLIALSISKCCESDLRHGCHFFRPEFPWRAEGESVSGKRFPQTP